MTTKGMVIYSDGGSRPIENVVGVGYGGYGIHGYIYENKKPDKGLGIPNYVATSSGYKIKQDNEEELVTPITYIDGFGSFSNPITNNAAELHGAKASFAIAKNQDIKDFTLYTDSKYVVNGINDWLNEWKKRSFVKNDGSEVANKVDWLDLDKQIQEVRDKGIEYQVKWLKGHNGDLGNEMADKSATVGVMHSKAGVLRSETDYKPTTGYFSLKTEKHPLLCNKRCYFTTRKETNVPGQYFLGDHGKEDDLIGKRSSEGTVAYVELLEPDPIIEMIKEKQIEEAQDTDIITMMRLDKLFSASVSNELNRYGKICVFRPSKIRIDMMFADGEPVTKGLQPPRLAMRAIEQLNELKGVLLSWRDDKNTKIKSTNITDLLFEPDKKDNLKLRSNVDNQVKKINANVCYGEHDLKYELDLYFGEDIPDRNTFKKIEKLQPCIHVLTWMEDEQTFRFATVISIKDAVGIYSPMSSNLRLLKKPTA